MIDYTIKNLKEVRAFEGGPNGCELIAFGAPCDPDSPDVEMEQGWWSD